MRQKRYESRTGKWIFRAVLAIVLAVVLGALGLFGYTMTIRALWKGDRLRLAEIINDAYHGRYCTMSCAGVETMATPRAVDFLYYNFMTSPDTVPLSTGAAAPADNAIHLVMPQATIVFTPVGDGTDTNVSWTQDGRTRGYTLHGVLPYSHLEQYFKNIAYWNSLDAKEQEAAEAP